MLTWDDLAQSDFFRWFSFREEARTTAPDGAARIHLKPGGYQDAIDLEIELDGRDQVRTATLDLDRAWVDGGGTAMLASDIAQSFLQTLAPDHPGARELAERIRQTPRGSQTILVRGDAPPPLPPATGAMAAALEVFQGGRDAAELSDASATLRLEHVSVEVRHRLRVTIQAGAGSVGTEAAAHASASRGSMIMQDDTYLSLFLDTPELPPGMRRSHDLRQIGHYNNDTFFDQYGGQQCGHATWDAPGLQGPIARIVDMRWLFPTAAAATAYHRAAVAQNAEGMPQVPHAPAVGADCVVVRDDLGRMGQQLTGTYEPHFVCAYLFTVERVVAKLFVSGVGEHPTVEEAAAIAARIPPRVTAAVAAHLTARVVAALSEPPAAQPAPAPGRRPWWRFWAR